EFITQISDLFICGRDIERQDDAIVSPASLLPLEVLPRAEIQPYVLYLLPQAELFLAPAGIGPLPICVSASSLLAGFVHSGRVPCRSPVRNSGEFQVQIGSASRCWPPAMLV